MPIQDQIKNKTGVFLKQNVSFFLFQIFFYFKIDEAGWVNKMWVIVLLVTAVISVTAYSCVNAIHYLLLQNASFPFPVGILYNFGDTGGTNVANFYQ